MGKERFEKILDKIIDRVETEVEDMSYAEIATVISLLTMCKYYTPWTLCGISGSTDEKDGESNA